VAFIFLAMLSSFRIKTLWALFIAGAVVAWLTEGVIVQTTYEALPLSISWTGLAWHALLTVWVGWYAVQKSFHSPTSFSTLKRSGVIGLCSGLWAISWWTEPDGGVASLGEFAAFSLGTTLLVIVAYWLANWSMTEPFAPNRWATIAISSLLVLYFLFVSVPAAPAAILILPVLLALAYLGLRRYIQNETEGSMLDHFNGRVSIWRFLSLLALPFMSIVVYGAALSLDLRWQTNRILYLAATPSGSSSSG
jgi:hypothetical protein